MTWVKLDDKFHRNPKITAMSDAAHRIYVDALSYAGDTADPTGFLGSKEAVNLVRSRGKHVSVIAELLKLSAWEEVPGGYLIHDFEKYLPQKSTERVRAWRDRKRQEAAATQPLRNSGETVSPAPAATVAKQLQNRSPHARAHPDPVPDPVPVSLNAPPTPSVSTASLRDALSNGHQDDLGLQLAIGVAELLGRDLAPLEVSMCSILLEDFAYLSVADMVQRMKSHLEHCKREKLPLPRKLHGFRETLRLENEHLADTGQPKAWRPPPIAGDLSRLMDRKDRDPDELDPDELPSQGVSR